MSSFAEVQSLLLQGGYHRARLTLPEFDIVAGGLAWGVLNSRFTIDVEFVENATIKDKIRVSENICRALKEDMQCPHDLLPHQIQGLDFPALRTVIKWLLRRVRAAREENEFFVRHYTRRAFRRRFGADVPSTEDETPSGATAEIMREPAKGGLHHRVWLNRVVRAAHSVADALALQRNTTEGTDGADDDAALVQKLRQARLSRSQFSLAVDALKAPPRVCIAASAAGSTAASRTPLEHVNSVLLEYGDRYVVHQLHPSAEAIAAIAAQQQTAGAQLGAADALELREQQTMKEEAEKEAELLDRLMETMAAHTERVSLSSATVGAVLDATDHSRASKAQSAYERRHAELQERLQEEAAARNAVENARELLSKLEADVALTKKKTKKIGNQVTIRQSEIDALAAEMDERASAVTEEAAQLESETAATASSEEWGGRYQQAVEAGSKRAALAASRDRATEQAKRQIALIKSECVSLHDELEARKAAAENAANQPGSEAATIATLEEKIKTLTAGLRAVELDTLNTQRLIDQFPTRLEVQQYETRIRELDEEIAWKYEENRLVFDQHNTATEVAKVLTNQVEVFQMAQETFESLSPKLASTAKADATNRTDFLEKLSTFKVQLNESQTSIANRLSADRDRLSALRSKYEATLARQRKQAELAEKLKERVAQLKELQDRAREMAAAAIDDDDVAL